MDAQLLRAKLAAATQLAEPASSAFDAALASLQQRAQTTPADVMNRSTLAAACDWGQTQPFLASARAMLAACAAKAVQALQSAGQLTPFYADRLRSSSGVK